MPRKGHTEEQSLQAHRQAEGGEKAAEIFRKLGISEQTSGQEFRTGNNCSLERCGLNLDCAARTMYVIRVAQHSEENC
jgi:hypothetical protein